MICSDCTHFNALHLNEFFNNYTMQCQYGNDFHQASQQIDS